MSNSFINKLYNYGIKSGAYGGKIIGLVVEAILCLF